MPEKLRMSGARFNIPELYETFPEIQPGDAPYRKIVMGSIIR